MTKSEDQGSVVAICTASTWIGMTVSVPRHERRYAGTLFMFYGRGCEPQPNLLIVHGLLLSIRGCPPERTFPHPQPGGRAGWPEEGTPGWLSCTMEDHSEGGSLDGGSRTHCRRETLSRWPSVVQRLAPCDLPVETINSKCTIKISCYFIIMCIMYAI